MTKTVLVTGSNRGIGLAFVKFYQEKGWKVIACVRNPQTADQLRELQPYRIMQLDTSKESSINAAANELKGEAIDVLINNAGVSEFDTFECATKESLMRVFEINTLGPFFVTRAFLPHLRAAVAASGQAKVCQLSSILGSLEEWSTIGVPGYYNYKMSKAALNMFNACFAKEHKDENIIAISFHPGCVVTDMTNHILELQLKWINADESASDMAKVLDGLTVEDAGKFFDNEGRVMAW